MLLLATLLACKPDPTPVERVTPPDDDDPQRYDDDKDLPVVDGGNANTNDLPDGVVEITQAGTWDLSPAGGPYTAMSGQMTVVEIVDGETDMPPCELTFALVGTAVATNTCASCLADDHVFDITWTLTSGDLLMCHDPDLQQMYDDQTDSLAPRTPQFGYGTGVVYYNWQGTGQWQPWYTATKIADQVSVTWTATLGISLEEEDP